MSFFSLPDSKFFKTALCARGYRRRRPRCCFLTVSHDNLVRISCNIEMKMCCEWSLRKQMYSISIVFIRNKTKCIYCCKLLVSKCIFRLYRWLWLWLLLITLFFRLWNYKMSILLLLLANSLPVFAHWFGLSGLWDPVMKFKLCIFTFEQDLKDLLQMSGCQKPEDTSNTQTSEDPSAGQ